VLTEAFTKGVAKLRSHRNSAGTTSTSFEQLGETLSRLDQISQSVATSTGLSQSQVARIAMGASAQLGLRLGVAGAQADASAGKDYLSGLSADQRRVLGSMSSDQIAAFKQLGDRIARDTATQALIAVDAREASELGSRLSSATSRVERAQAAFSERTAVATRLASARDRDEAIAIDMAQDPHNLEMFLRYTQQYGGDSKAALSLFDAELARQAPKPIRVPEAAALPASFAEVRSHYETTETSFLSMRTPTEASESNARAVQDAQLAYPTQKPGAAERRAADRSDVMSGGRDIRERTAAARRQFDDQSEITTSSDGTVTTKKSLLLQSGRQVAEDAWTTTDETKKALGKALKRK